MTGRRPTAMIADETGAGGSHASAQARYWARVSENQ